MSVHYWMIEKSINGQAHWWIPDHSESTHWDDPCRWTTDSSKARHYNEEWEAKYVMGGSGGDMEKVGCVATGHIDCDGPDLTIPWDK